jgi:hypothetical protein
MGRVKTVFPLYDVRRISGGRTQYVCAEYRYQIWRVMEIFRLEMN